MPRNILCVKNFDRYMKIIYNRWERQDALDNCARTRKIERQYWGKYRSSMILNSSPPTELTTTITEVVKTATQEEKNGICSNIKIIFAI